MKTPPYYTPGVTPDGLFTLRKVCIPNVSNGKTFTLIPFGDVHRDSNAFADAEWKAFLERGRNLQNGLFLGMGDYFDSYSFSERVIIADHKVHDSTKRNMENESKNRVRELAKELSFMRGKCIGILSGNHYVSYSDGTTCDMILAQALNAPFMGECAAFRLRLEESRGTVPWRARYATVDIFAHHGRGGGRTTGGRMQAVDELQKICEADIFLMGDNHARGALPVGDKLRIISPCGKLYIRTRRAWIGRTGSFLKGYEPGTSSYVAHRALPPASLGWIEFDLTMVRIRNEGDNRLAIDIHARQ